MKPQLDSTGSQEKLRVRVRLSRSQENGPRKDLSKVIQILEENRDEFAGLQIGDIGHSSERGSTFFASIKAEGINGDLIATPGDPVRFVGTIDQLIAARLAMSEALQRDLSIQGGADFGTNLQLGGGQTIYTITPRLDSSRVN